MADDAKSGAATVGAQQIGLLDGEARPAEAPRGPGRPAGAKNKRTKAWQQWFGATGELPLEFLAKTYRRSTADLARELECDRDAALRIQVDAAKAVLPYLEQKLPLAIEDQSEGKRMVVVVGEMTAEQRDQASDRLGWKVLDNQPISDAETVRPFDGKSDDGDNALIEHDKSSDAD